MRRVERFDEIAVYIDTRITERLSRLGYGAGSTGLPAGSADGAALAASYLTVAVSPALANERALVMGNLMATPIDGGPGGTYTIGVDSTKLTVSGGKLDKTGGGTLTLQSSSNYTVDVPTSGTLALGAATLSATSISNVTTSTHSHAVTTTTAAAVNTIVATDGNGYTQLVRLGIGTGAAPSFPLHVVGTGTLARFAYDASYYTNLSTNSGGSFVIQPIGDLIADIGGTTLRANINYKTDLGAITTKWRVLHVAEVWAEALIASEKVGTTGGRFFTGFANVLVADVPAGAGSPLTIAFVGSPTFAGSATGTSGGGYQTITQRGATTSMTATGGSGNITFIDSASTDLVNGTSLTISKPAGTLQNHTMWAGLHYDDSVTMTVPSGWTLYQTDTYDGLIHDVYYKVAGASEPSSYTWALSISENANGWIATYAGGDTTTPYDTFVIQSNETASTNMASGSLTTGVSNAVVLFSSTISLNQEGDVTVVPPSGWTGRAGTGTGDGWFRNWMGDRTYASSGSSVSATATLSGARKTSVILVALKPAPSGTTSGNISLPTGATDDDQTFMCARWDSTTATLTPPAGWSQLGSTQTGDNGRLALYRRKFAGGDPSSVSWSVNANCTLVVDAISYYNVDPTTPTDATTVFKLNNTASTNLRSDGITTATNGAKAIMFGGVIDTSGGSTTVAPTSTWAEQVDTGTGAVRAHIQDKTISSPGSTGTIDATLSAAKKSITAMVALRPLFVTGADSNSVSPAKPTGTASGHSIWAVTVRAGGALTAPSGWVSVASQVVNGGAVEVLRKAAGGSEPSNYTFTTDSTASLSAQLFTLSNTNATVVDVLGSWTTASTTTLRGAGITPLVTGDMLILAGGCVDTSAGTVTATPPGGMTEQGENGAGTTMVYVASQLLASTSATGNKDATLSSAKQNGGILIAVKAATSGSNNYISVKYNNFGSTTAAEYPIVYLEKNLQVEWMQVVVHDTPDSGKIYRSYTLDGATVYEYRVVRDLDGTGANAWAAGDGVFSTGITGQGWIEQYALYGVNSNANVAGGTQRAGPTTAYNVRTGTGHNQFDTLAASGNLQGLYDYATTRFGFAAGKYTGRWFSIDEVNGLRFMSGATKLLQVDSTPAITIGEVATNKANTYITAGEIRFRGGTSGAQSYFKIAADGRAVFIQGNAASNSLNWETTSSYDVVAQVYGWRSSGVSRAVTIAYGYGTTSGTVELVAYDVNNTAVTFLRVLGYERRIEITGMTHLQRGLSVGTTYFSPLGDGQVYVTGNASFNNSGLMPTYGVSVGTATVDYTPTAGTWSTTAATLLLNAATYSTIGFHDSGSRVDYIRVGAGFMVLGHDGGYGSARVEAPGGISTMSAMTAQVFASATTYGALILPIERACVLTQWTLVLYVATTNNGSNRYYIELKRLSDSAVIDAFYTSDAGAANTWIRVARTLALTMNPGDLGIYLDITKVGSPGQIQLGSNVYLK